MRIIGSVVTTNSEQPLVVVDLTSLSQDLQNKIVKAQNANEYYVVITYDDVAELFDKQIIRPYPCMIDAEIQFIAD